MSSKVKQANFRLPLEYMDLIDEFAKRSDITKAAVITRALDCLKASYDSGNNGMPVSAGSVGAAGSAGAPSGASSAELDSVKNQLSAAERKLADATRDLEAASSRAAAAERARDDAEAKARQLSSDLAIARSSANAPAPATPSVDEAELTRLRDLVAQQNSVLEQRTAAKDAEISSKNAAIAERDAKIAMLSEQLGAANAKAELALKNINVEAVTIGDNPAAEDEQTRALAMLNMIGGVMNAFQQQVDDARIIGEQEGRMAVQHELQDTIEKARNDGYRDAMSYLDDRVTTARDSGAREERARIANMAFFERRRYLRMHLA